MSEISLHTTIAIIAILHSTTESHLFKLPTGKELWVKKNMCKNLRLKSVAIQLAYLKEILP